METEQEILPREKIQLQGVRALSDTELLTVILGSGTRASPIREVAQRVLPVVDRYGIDLGVEHLQSIRGIGSSKALGLIAAIELVRRRIRPDGTRISCARDVLPLVNHLLDRPQEHVVVLSLSGAHEVVRMRTVCIGLLASCPIHPREVLIGAIRDRAYSVIVAHNHPSGDPKPSEEDRRVTESLKVASSTLGIRLLDHVIFARRGYYSFQESGLL